MFWKGTIFNQGRTEKSERKDGVGGMMPTPPSPPQLGIRKVFSWELRVGDSFGGD